MAYSGTTAATSVSNPPSRVDNSLLSQRNINESTSVANGGSVWTYTSTNLTTDLATANFFSDAKALGMRTGDIVIAATYSTESSTGMELVIGMITGVSTSGAALSTANGLISSTFG
jgi:hypothetical protein